MTTGAIGHHNKRFMDHTYIHAVHMIIARRGWEAGAVGTKHVGYAVVLIGQEIHHTTVHSRS